MKTKTKVLAMLMNGHRKLLKRKDSRTGEPDKIPNSMLPVSNISKAT